MNFFGGINHEQKTKLNLESNEAMEYIVETPKTKVSSYACAAVDIDT